MPVVSSSMHLFEKPLRYTEIGMVSQIVELSDVVLCVGRVELRQVPFWGFL